MSPMTQGTEHAALPAERAQRARELEAALGDPRAAEGYSFREALVQDETESFPEPLHAAITRWGLNECYIPRECGGQFTSFEELMQLVTAVARRDLTAAIAHSAIYLGAACMWMRGTAAQQS